MDKWREQLVEAVEGLARMLARKLASVLMDRRDELVSVETGDVQTTALHLRLA